MADTVFSTKVDETVKARFEGMAQAAGTTQKEFFSRLWLQRTRPPRYGSPRTT